MRFGWRWRCQGEGRCIYYHFTWAHGNQGLFWCVKIRRYVYGFSGTSWVLITMAPRNTVVFVGFGCRIPVRCLTLSCGLHYFLLFHHVYGYRHSIVVLCTKRYRYTSLSDGTGVAKGIIIQILRPPVWQMKS